MGLLIFKYLSKHQAMCQTQLSGDFILPVKEKRSWVNLTRNPGLGLSSLVRNSPPCKRSFGHVFINPMMLGGSKSQYSKYLQVVDPISCSQKKSTWTDATTRLYKHGRVRRYISEYYAMAAVDRRCHSCRQSSFCLSMVPCLCDPSSFWGYPHRNDVQVTWIRVV